MVFNLGIKYITSCIIGKTTRCAPSFPLCKALDSIMGNMVTNLKFIHKFAIALFLIIALGYNNKAYAKPSLESLLIKSEYWPITIKGYLYITDIPNIDKKGTIEWSPSSFFLDHPTDRIQVIFEKDFFKNEQMVSILKKHKALSDDKINFSEMAPLISISIDKPIVKTFFGSAGSYFFPVKKINQSI